MESEERHDTNGWPNGDDTLLPMTPGLHSGHIDCYDQSLSRIAGCYNKAAMVLVDAIAADVARPDPMIVPLVFLRRHALELMMKGIIADAAMLNGKKAGYEYTHDLRKLWDAVVRIFKDVHRDNMSAEISVATRMIEEFSEHDPDSIEFRYPAKKDGGPTLPQVPCIDVLRFNQAMDRLQNLIRDLGNEIGRRVEDLRDYEAM